MISEIFRTILYQPLFNALIFLYKTVALEDLGIAIILLTIIVRIILYPLFYKTAKHQRVAQKLQPEINKIKKEHKDNREKQTKAIMELYKKENTNPLTPFLLLLLQLPVLIALYRLFSNGLSSGALDLLYSFVSRPETFNNSFLGLFPLAETYIPIVILAAGAQYFQGRIAIAKLSNKNDGDQDQAQKIAKMMMYAGPVIALVILTRLPSAVALYWLTSTIFSLLQQIIVNRAVDKKDNESGTTNKNK